MPKTKEFIEFEKELKLLKWDQEEILDAWKNPRKRFFALQDIQRVFDNRAKEEKRLKRKITPKKVTLEQRPKQINCQNEPAYPEHETVVFSISAPDMTAHLKTDLCSIECPHPITECGIWVVAVSSEAD